MEGLGSDFVVLMRPVAATGCENLQLVVHVSQDHAERLVPDPFRPAPSPLTGEDAAMVVEVHACESAEVEPSGGYSRAWVGVFVETPVLPEPATLFQRDNRTDRTQADHDSDVYVLASYVDSQVFHQFLRQSGIPFERAWIDIDLDGVLDAQVAQVAVEDREIRENALRFVGHTLADERFIEHRTSWATTRHGVQAFEELRTAPDEGPVQYHTGTAACLVSEYGLFTHLFPSPGCNPASLRIATGFDTHGHSLWFHDTRVLE